MSRFFLVFLAVMAFMAGVTIAQSAANDEVRVKRAINPFMDSIGKRSQPYRFETLPKRYFDGISSQTGNRRSAYLIPVYSDE